MNKSPNQQITSSKGFTAVIWVLTAPLLCSCGASVRDAEQSEMSAEEALVRKTLELALVERELPDVELLLEQEVVISADENIDPEWVPKFENIQIRVMESADIEAGDVPIML